jgi:hypothetical protein
MTRIANTLSPLFSGSGTSEGFAQGSHAVTDYTTKYGTATDRKVRIMTAPNIVASYWASRSSECCSRSLTGAATTA